MHCFTFKVVLLWQNVSIIIDEYRPAKITVTCKEDLESENGWIEVILPQKLRRGREKQVAAKVQFMAGKFLSSSMFPKPNLI